MQSPLQFRYRDSPVFFDEDYAGTGMTRVSTFAHGELGYMWETSNGTWSARVGTATYGRHIGNQTAAFRWIIENQPQ